MDTVQRLTAWLLRCLYSRYVPHPVRNLLRLQFELVRRGGMPAVVQAPAACRVLVLAPHMDDEVFACGGTLAKCIGSGGEVVVVYLTDGSKGYKREPTLACSTAELQALETRLVARRKEEARQAGQILGLSEPIFLDLPDAALDVTPPAIKLLSDALRRVAPDVVYLPFLTDPYPDHWITNCLFVEAALHTGLSPTVPCWGYEAWAPVVTNTIVDITDVIEAKRQAMDKFVSQITDYDYPRAMLGLNAYRSLLNGRGQGFAEAFYTVDFALYRGLYEAVVVRRRRF